MAPEQLNAEIVRLIDGLPEIRDALGLAPSVAYETAVTTAGLSLECSTCGKNYEPPSPGITMPLEQECPCCGGRVVLFMCEACCTSGREHERHADAGL